MKSRASRRNVLTFALSGLCVALAVLALLPPPAPAPEAVPRQAVAPAIEDKAVTTLVRTGGRDGPAFRRPIFLPSRRLPGGGEMTVSGLKLRAVFLGPGTKKALVETAPGDQAVWVTNGQNLGEWQVEEINAENLVLQGRNGRRTLELEKPDVGAVKRPVRTSQKPK